MPARFSRIEDELIIALCSHEVPNELVKRYVGYPGIDWAYVVETARRHKVEPLVFSRALAFDMPEGSRALLSRHAKDSVAANIHDALVFREELRKVRRALTESGIDCILLKGLSLNPTLVRPMGDIDLLVPRERLADAIEAILEVPGYAYREKPFRAKREIWRYHSVLTAAPKALLVQLTEWQHEFQMYNEERGVMIELHVALFDREGRRDDHAWGAASGEEIVRRIWAERHLDAELGCDVPSAEHSLLTMCLHAAIKRSPANNVFRFGTLVDVDNLVSSGIRWDRFTRECADLRVSPYAYFSLLLARRLLAVPIPSCALSRLRRACTPFQLMLTRFHLRCADSLVSSNSLYSILYRWLQPWAFEGNWHDRLRWSFLIPVWQRSRAFMANLLDVDIRSSFLPLAYMLLPARWMLQVLCWLAETAKELGMGLRSRVLKRSSRPIAQRSDS